MLWLNALLQKVLIILTPLENPINLARQIPNTFRGSPQLGVEGRKGTKLPSIVGACRERERDQRHLVVALQTTDYLVKK